jgi:polyisoprenoid-binding protein YceI
MDTIKGKQTGTTTRTKWLLDPAHSEVTFKVKHMMISNVTGLLKDYTVDVTAEDEEFSNAEVTFVGKLNSITTGNEERDNHLKSADFFDVEINSEIIFRSTRFTRNDDDITLEGEITIKGITKPLILDVEFGGIQKDPWGNTKAGFAVKGKLNRRDFGLNWNTALETGGVLVGDEVKIIGEIQLTKESR